MCRLNRIAQLESDVDGLGDIVGPMDGRINTLTNRVDQVETLGTTVAAIDNRVANNTNKIADLEVAFGGHETRIVALENAA